MLSFDTWNTLYVSVMLGKDRPYRPVWAGLLHHWGSCPAPSSSQLRHDNNDEGGGAPRTKTVKWMMEDVVVPGVRDRCWPSNPRQVRGGFGRHDAGARTGFKSFVLNAS